MRWIKRLLPSRAARRPQIADSATGPKPAALPTARMDEVDREFLPAALELFETPPSPVSIAAIWLICAVFATALAWSYFGWLEIYAVAQGRIQPSGRSKIVQSLDPGRVVAIAVENGSRVAAGNLLIELDSRETGADRKERERDLEASLAEAARRRVAIAAARSGSKEAPQVIYPEGTSKEIRAREDRSPRRRPRTARFEPGKPFCAASRTPRHVRAPQGKHGGPRKTDRREQGTRRHA